MDRFLRDILLFFLVVMIITGLFFGTKGCGVLDKQPLELTPLKNQSRLLGPTLARKQGLMIFRPGAKVWQEVKGGGDWREQAAEAISEKAMSALDTLEVFTAFEAEEVKALVDSVIKAELEKAEWKDLSTGEKDFWVDVSAIARALNYKYNPEMEYPEDKTAADKAPAARPRGNY